MPAAATKVEGEEVAGDGVGCATDGRGFDGREVVEDSVCVDECEVLVARYLGFGIIVDTRHETRGIITLGGYLGSKEAMVEEEVVLRSAYGCRLVGGHSADVNPVALHHILIIARDDTAVEGGTCHGMIHSVADVGDIERVATKIAQVVKLRQGTVRDGVVATHEAERVAERVGYLAVADGGAAVGETHPVAPYLVDTAVGKGEFRVADACAVAYYAEVTAMNIHVVEVVAEAGGREAEAFPA